MPLANGISNQQLNGSMLNFLKYYVWRKKFLS